MASSAPESQVDAATSRREVRRQRHQDLSRMQFLDAAEEVFGEKGFHDTTLKEVAELAEFSVGSVYSFFESKDDLFGQVFVRRGEEFMPRLRDLLRSDGDPVRQLHDLVDFQVNFFRERPHFGRLFLTNSNATMRTATGGLDAPVAGNVDESLALQADLFRRGQEAGVFRDGDPRVLARLFSGIMSAYQATDLMVNGSTSDDVGSLSLDDFRSMVEAAFARS